MDESISRAEADILHFVLDHQPVTVRQAAEALGPRRGIARTTVLTHLERLRQKGYLIREEVHGINHYRGARPREELLRDAVSDFVTTALGGSLSPFIAYLTEKADLSTEEAAELERMIEKIEKEDRS